VHTAMVLQAATELLLDFCDAAHARLFECLCGVAALCYFCHYCVSACMRSVPSRAICLIQTNGGAIGLEVATTVETEDCVFTSNRVTIDSLSTDIGDGGTASSQQFTSTVTFVGSYFTVAFTAEVRLTARYTVRIVSLCDLRCTLYDRGLQ
jgi:hypothetical protein